MTHPSIMPSFFAPPMPFHPEELHRDVRLLEQIYDLIPIADTNLRTSLAKAIICATSNFMEGCLDSMTVQTLGELRVPQPISNHVLDGLRGLADKTTFAKERLAPLRKGWQVKDDASSQFVENRLGQRSPGLRQLRNWIDHGEVMAQTALRLNDVAYFRRAACAYLEQVYTSLGIETPAWLGKA